MITTRDRDEFLVSTVIKLIKRKATPNLKKVIAKTHAADIARWFPHLRPEEKTLMFELLLLHRCTLAALSMNRYAFSVSVNDISPQSVPLSVFDRPWSASMYRFIRCRAF